jgi:pimeloyl-ACP methyl ester carboxylesterase
VIVALNYHRSGQGEPLVLIHGIGSRLQVWDPVLPHLEPEREVIALDLPGFGASPMPPHDEPPGLATLLAGVTGLLDELGLERPHVAGNSLGGWLTLELAKRGRARTATALSPAGFWLGLEGARSRAQLFAMVRSARLAARYADTLLQAPIARRLSFAQVVDHGDRMTPTEAADTLRALAHAPSFDGTLKAMLKQSYRAEDPIEVPVTIAWAEHDHLLAPRQALWAAHLIPNARSVLLYGCGHVPTYDDPEQVGRVLLEGSRG